MAQKTIEPPKLATGQPEPFVLETGSSFSASNSEVRTISTLRSTELRDLMAAELRDAETILERFYVDPKKVTQPAMTKSAVVGMLHTLDPHSNFFDAREWKELLDEQRSSYSGIGMSFAAFSSDGLLDSYVLSTFPGTPAQKSGLGFGDKLVSINGTRLAGMSPDLIRELIRGPSGTNIRIEIERYPDGRVETIDLRRSVVSQPSIPDHYLIRDSIGYIDLTEGFSYTTSIEFSKALHDLHLSGMRSLIIDLRGNGGGIVDQAAMVAEKFLPAGSLIVTQRGRRVSDNREWRSRNKTPETCPLVLLVDENTASASEIVVGALQDWDRALVVGNRTFGKGLVQSVIDLPRGNGLTLTAARYFTPTGRSIQRDYSAIGRYDYFSQRGKSHAIGRPLYEAHTITDRVLFGGDGINPDEIVKPDRITEERSRLLDPIFYFAREIFALHANKSRPADSYLRPVIPGTDRALNDHLFDEFLAWAKRKWPNTNIAELAATDAGFVKTRLNYNLTLARSGTNAAMRVLRSSDQTIQIGISSLPKAQKLAQLAEKKRRSSLNSNSSIFGIQ